MKNMKKEGLIGLIAIVIGASMLFFGDFFAMLQENTPWFFMMVIMIVCTIAVALWQYIPLKWLPVIIIAIVAISLGGLYLVPEDSVDYVQNQIMLPVMIVAWLILMFVGVRYQRKHNRSKVFRWQSRLLRMGNKNIMEEIDYYNSQPFTFQGFMDLPKLTDENLRLVCTNKAEAIPDEGFVPSYEFDIYRDSERVGDIRLHIGYHEGIYYSGHIDCVINEAHRGKGYAVRAIRLLAPVAQHHGMEKLLITSEDGNMSSYRVCEKLGARFIRKTELPHWHDIYEEGHLYMNIFEWDLRNYENRQNNARRNSTVQQPSVRV